MLLQRYFNFQIVCVMVVLVAVSSYAPRRIGVVSQTAKVSCKPITIGLHRPALTTRNTGRLAANELVSSAIAHSHHFPKLLMGVVATFTSFSKQASAAALDKALDVENVKGWDLYGRVPCDDFLFSTARLANPDLLKRSFAEAVTQEIPIVLSTFNRRKAIYTGLVLVKGAVCILGGLALVGAIVVKAREQMRRERQLETEIRGFYTPVSATYKGARKQGRQVEGVQGWVDMSRRNPRTSEQDSEEPEGDGDEDNDKDRDLDLVDGEKGDESGPRGKNSGSGNNGGVGGGEHDDGNPSATKKPADSRPQGPRGTSDKNQDGRRPSSGGGRGGGGTGGSDSKGGNSGKGKNTGSSADDSKGGKGPKGKGPRDKGSGAGSKGNKSADDDDDLYDV